MEKFRIGYLDEDDSDLASFYSFINQYLNYDFIDIKPKEDIEELIEFILSSNLDLLVIDYRINEYEDINYNGVHVYEYVKNVRKDFPCIILTSNAEDAIADSFDTHIVYSKSIPFDGDSESKKLFELKLRKNIEHYQTALKNATDELYQLNEKDSLSLSDEERIIELDDFLESNLINYGKIPKHLKVTSHIDSVKVLINKAEGIIARLDKNEIHSKKN